MTPLVRCTLWYIVGLMVPFYLVPEVSELVRASWITSVFVGVACLAVRRTRAARRSASGAHVVALMFAVLGVVAGGTARNRADNDCRSRLPHNAVVHFVGQPASLPGADGGFALQLIDADAPRSGIGRCSGIVRARLPKDFDGRRIDARALSGSAVWMTFPPSTRIPLTPDRRGVLLIRSAEYSAGDVPTSLALAMRVHAQQRFRATLRQSGLAEALVLAQREGVDKTVNDAFTSTGMSHLLSISGTHVGLVAALLLGFAGFMRLSGQAGRIAATTGVIAYVGFLGAPAAAARSAIQVLLLLAGRMLQRPSDPYSVLAAAALWLLVQQPLNLLDAGFQLSFAGVIGLIAYRRRIAERLPRKMPAWLRDGIAASLAASGVTMPIAAIQFGTIAPIGIPASIIAVPLVGLALPAVARVRLVGGVSPGAAPILANGADQHLDGVAWVAKVAQAVPGGHAPLSPDTLLLSLLLAGGVVFGLSWRREVRTGRAHTHARTHDAHDARFGTSRSAMLARGAVAVSACAACIAWLPSLISLHDSRTLMIHAIDVGQGDAIALRTPHGHWILIDAGPRDRKFDAGKSRVLPFLLKHGAQHLDAIVLTHPHADHIGGAASLLSTIGATAVIDPTTPVGETMYLQTMRIARAHSAHWMKSRDGHHLDVDGVRIDFLYPASDSLDGSGDANDLSVVLRVGYGSFAAIFMGDAPTTTEDRLVAEYGTRLAASVLKVGHHGSYTATGDAFLDAVKPALAIVSVGRDNRYGHPNPGVVARLLRHKVRVLRTDEHGAIVVAGRADGQFTVGTQR
jgi:competence protein ComEC